MLISFEAFRVLAELASKVDEFAQWPDEEIEKHVRPIPRPHAGLLGTLPVTSSVLGLEAEKDRIRRELGPWPKGLDRHWAHFEKADGYKWLQQQPAFVRLWESFDRKRRNKKAGTFADPRAKAWLIESCGMALLLWFWYTEKKKRPRQPGIAVKRKALEAVKHLIECEQSGMRFAELAGDLPLPWDWLQKLRQGVEVSLDQHERSYSDPDSASCECVKTFAQWLFFRFHEAPTTIVERFAALIGYSSDRLPRYLKEWRTSFATRKV